MAKYTVIGPSYRSGFNNPDRAHTAAEQIAKRTGGEVVIVHKYQTIAKYGPEGRIDIDGIEPNEVTLIFSAKHMGARAFNGRLEADNIKRIIHDMRNEFGRIDEIPFSGQLIETPNGFRAVFDDGFNFDIVFAILGDA
jgi:hypothetical protein